MAKYVHKDAYISVNGTVLSDHANQITIEDAAEEVDFTGFTAAGYREFGQGLKDATITATSSRTTRQVRSTDPVGDVHGGDGDGHRGRQAHIGDRQRDESDVHHDRPPLQLRAGRRRGR